MSGALAAGFLVLPAVLLAVAVMGAIRRDRARFGPAMRRFCSALGVGAADRRMLERRARGVGVPSAALLLSRGCFDAAAAHAPPGEARRLASIRRRVFE